MVLFSECRVRGGTPVLRACHMLYPVTVSGANQNKQRQLYMNPTIRVFLPSKAAEKNWI